MYNLSIWTKKCCRSGMRLGRDVAQGCYTKGCWVVRRCQAYPPQSTAGTTQTANPWWLSLTEFSLLAAPSPCNPISSWVAAPNQSNPQILGREGTLSLGSRRRLSPAFCIFPPSHRHGLLVATTVILTYPCSSIAHQRCPPLLTPMT